MKTFHRICLQDYHVTDGKVSFVLKRGAEYITSVEREDGTVTVFTQFWISGIPVSLFGGSVPGPGDRHDEPAQPQKSIKCPQCGGELRGLPK